MRYLVRQNEKLRCRWTESKRITSKPYNRSRFNQTWCNDDITHKHTHTMIQTNTTSALNKYYYFKPSWNSRQCPPSEWSTTSGCCPSRSKPRPSWTWSTGCYPGVRRGTSGPQRWPCSIIEGDPVTNELKKKRGDQGYCCQRHTYQPPRSQNGEDYLVLMVI